MSGIPTNIIQVQLIDDGRDPAAGGGGSPDFGPMLDALRGIQINVGSLNQNVRAILETLRRMATGRGGGMGGAGRAGGARGTPRQAGSRIRFASDLAEYREAIRGGASLSDIMRESHASLLDRYRTDREGLSPRELRAGMKLRQVELYGERVAGSRTAREEAARLRDEQRAAREAARAQKAAQVEQMRQQRAASAAARRAQAEAVRASKLRMSGSMAERISELRRRMNIPGATSLDLGLTSEEQDVLAGRASPSGLPGTRAHFRAIGGMVQSLAPAPPPARRPQTMWGGVMQMVTMVGRILAVGGMVLSFLGRIWGALKAISAATMAQRQEFSRIDPIFAQMEAQYRISALRADIAVAQSPILRQAMQQFTNTQIARSAAGVPVRQAMSTIRTAAGTFFERFLLGYELVAGGALSGNTTNLGLGYLSVIGNTLGLANPVFALLNQYLQSWIVSQVTKNGNLTNNKHMIDPLVSMTAGRFDVNRPYVGKGAGASNWWWGTP